jgi:Ca2+-binding EF-hand superfamily protein
MVAGPCAPPATPAQKAPLDRAAAFARIDANHDGVLTLAEYLAAQAGGANLEARFKKFDKNGDGKISREEFLHP